MSLDGPLERLLALEQLAGTVNERLLEVQTRLDLHVDAYVYELAANPGIPKLRDAGVVYAPDPFEEFGYSSISRLLEDGRAAAEELAAWRAAELRMQGEVVELRAVLDPGPWRALRGSVGLAAVVSMLDSAHHAGAQAVGTDDVQCVRGGVPRSSGAHRRSRDLLRRAAHVAE